MPRFSPGRIAVALFMAAGLSLAGCADSPTGPDADEWKLDPLLDLGCGDYNEPCGIPPVANWCADHPNDPECPDRPEECPWNEGGECDDGPPDPDPWEPGDGGGGGGGGGGGHDTGDGYYLDLTWEELCHLYADPGCEWRDPTEWTSGERVAIEESIRIIRDRCKPEGDLLGAYLNTRRIHLWDVRVSRGAPDDPALQGRVEPQTDDILMWTGYNKEPQDIVNWTETLTHEAIHLTLDVTTHPPEFDERLEECT